MKPPNRTSLRNRIGLRDLWKRKDRAFELRKQAQLGKRRPPKLRSDRNLRTSRLFRPPESSTPVRKSIPAPSASHKAAISVARSRYVISTPKKGGARFLMIVAAASALRCLR